MRITLALVLAAMVIAVAHAADPGVCRPYATALINSHMSWLWSRAYTACLNMEDDAPTPPDNAEGAMRILDPALTPIVMPEPPARPARPAPPASPATPAPAAGPGKSGFARDSDQWQAWCRRNYPRSFDEKTGTVILPTSRKRVRTPCPG